MPCASGQLQLLQLLLLAGLLRPHGSCLCAVQNCYSVLLLSALAAANICCFKHLQTHVVNLLLQTNGTRGMNATAAVWQSCRGHFTLPRTTQLVLLT